MNVKKMFLYCLLATSLTACNQSEEMDEIQGSNEVTFRIKASELSRAGKEQFKDGDAIGIYAVERTQDGTVAAPVTNGRANNAKWIRENGEWKPATAADRITWSQKGTKMDFYAYYPYTAGIENPAAIALDLNGQGENLEGADVLRAANTTGLSTGEVTLSFEHVLGMLHIVATDLTAEGDVVKVSGVKLATSLNLGSGEITTAEDATAGILTLSSLGNGVFEGIMPPQTFSGEIQCEHNGSVYIHTFTDLAVETAKIKQINLTLK